MQPRGVQPFNQFINWFRLDIEAGKVYEIPISTPGQVPSDSFIEHNEQHYSLEQKNGYNPLAPDEVFLRRIIDSIFRKALGEKGFAFKGGRGSYVAYWKEKQFPHPYTDIFSVYTASFEYRVVSCDTGDENAFYLSIDPHVVFVMNMSIEGLASRGVPSVKLCNNSVRVSLPETQAKYSGIDGFLSEIVTDKERGVLCRVADSRTGKVDLHPAGQVFLEPRPEIIRSVLLAMGENYDVVKLGQEKSFLSSTYASRDRLGKTQNIVGDYLLKKVFPLESGEFKIGIEVDPTPVRGFGFPRAGQINEPAILFDKDDSSAVHLQAYWGLRTFGSYTKDLPIINVALLGTQRGIQQLDVLMKQMNSGTQIMPGGMRGFFNTELKVIERETIKTETNEDYIAGAESLGVKSGRRGQKPDVVIAYLAKGTSNFELDTPYYNTKPVLLKHDIASQMITQLALNDTRWIHANLASAIFAKAGGHPWVLAKDIADFDMIMGVALSESISKTKRAGARTRYLGYANVFDEQGRWMFFESTALIYDSRTHEQQLSDLVDLSVERFHKARGHYPRSIAIHYYKRFGWREINRVMETLDAKNKGSRVAFITIDKSHPMRLYDVRTPDGSYPRAHYAQTFENEFLLSTTGHTELAKKRKGTPAILKVTVKQRPETFVSLESVAEQILALTRLNHKTLTPIVGEPVTLLYANLVANFTAVFSEGQWKDAQAGEMHKLNTVPWFL